MRRSFFYFFIFGVPVALSAQELQSVDTLKVSEDVPWEKLFETGIEDDENSSAVDEASQLEDHPLNLNTASLEELHRIPAMTNVVASRIATRRKITPFTSLDELITIEGVTPEMLSFIRPYVRVGKMKERSNMAGAFLSKASTEIEKRKGFVNTAYPGSSIKILNKFRLAVGSKESPLTSAISVIEVGAVAEKDPGERSLTGFSSGFGCVSLPEFSTRLIIGNYQVEAAEGLIFWRASAFSKGSDVIAPTRKNGSGIHPYLSSDENSFLQGIATSLEFSPLQLQMFYSNKSINATIDSLGQISSFDQSGLFRTENEVRKQKSTRETIIGFRSVVHFFEGFKLGGTAYRTQFKNPLILKNGNGETTPHLWMQGMDISYTNRTIDLFTELAVDRSHEIAMIGGMTYEPMTMLSLSLVARQYPPAFQSIHGNAFGESGKQVQNENGVYVGIRMQPVTWLWFSTYYDQFDHPQPTLFIPASSHGNDFLALAECQITNTYKLAFRFKRKESPLATDKYDLYGRMIKQVISRIQENYRLTSELISSSSVCLASRIEWAKVTYAGLKKSEQGLLFSQTLKCILFRSLALRARVAVFETDSYDSRIYEYEDDLPRASSNPALYGRGLRWYLILRYHIFLKVDISAKYSQTIKDGVKSLGSGLDEIEGNTQSLLSMQLDVRF
jgi:hypothetical protein